VLSQEQDFDFQKVMKIDSGKHYTNSTT